MAAAHKIGVQSLSARDVEFIRALLDGNFDGEVEVYTSTLSIAECQFVRGDIREVILSDAVKEAFRTVLLSGHFVILVQDTPIVGEQARDLRWVHNLAFSGADAVHVASAISSGCEEFLTFDHKSILSKEKELFDLFGLRAVYPRMSGAVPLSKHPEVGPLYAHVIEEEQKQEADNGQQAKSIEPGKEKPPQSDAETA